MPDIDSDILDLTMHDTTDNTNNSNNSKNNANNNGKKRKKSKTRKQYTDIEKLASFGPASIEGIDMIKIKEEILELVTAPAQVNILLDRIKMEYKKRALGADQEYEKTVGSRGKVVMKKLPLLSSIKWANKAKRSGGGGMAFSDIEYMALIKGACNFVSIHHEALKCDRKLPPYNVANGNKIHKAYVFIMDKTKIGWRYPNQVVMRTPSVDR